MTYRSGTGRKLHQALILEFRRPGKAKPAGKAIGSPERDKTDTPAGQQSTKLD